MLNYNGDVNETHSKETKAQVFHFIKLTPDLWLLSLNRPAHEYNNGKNAYALRGFPGSDRSSVEFEALWTGPVWCYLVPGKNSRRWTCMEFERNIQLTQLDGAPL